MAGQGCPDCASYGFKLAESAVIYVFKALPIDEDISIGEGFIAYGKTNNWNQRLITYNRLFKGLYKIVNVLLFDFEFGYYATKFENKIRQKKAAHVHVTIEGLKTESINLMYESALIKWINKQYLKMITR